MLHAGQTYPFEEQGNANLQVFEEDNVVVIAFKEQVHRLSHTAFAELANLLAKDEHSRLFHEILMRKSLFANYKLRRFILSLPFQQLARLQECAGQLQLLWQVCSLPGISRPEQ